MRDWQKISLILGSVVALTIIASFSFRAFSEGYEVKKNSGNVPAAIARLDNHIISDNKKAIIDSMKNIQFVTALNGLSATVKELNETVKENNRLMQYAKFTQRK